MSEVVRVEFPDEIPVAGVLPGNYRIYHFADGTSLRVFSRRSLDESMADAATDLVETFGAVGSAGFPVDGSAGSSSGSPSVRSAKGSMLRRPEEGREAQLEDALGAAVEQVIG